MELPQQGVALETLLDRMRERKQADADWRSARTFSLVYPAGEQVDAVVQAASHLYLHENALNPFRFPSIRQMEDDVVSMTLSLLHASPEAGGAMTSGGTESILLGVKTARDRARAERGVERASLLVPHSAHPAFAKAAQVLDMDLVQIPLDTDHRADVKAARRLIDERTVLIVGSAPNYPFGVADPIPDLAALAAERGLSFHTDACLGGFLLPFYERLGAPVPPFDFRVEGVTTISSDVHKYGYSIKGASVIAHRDSSTLRNHQLFLYEDWPGGIYGSFAMAGARPAAPIAAAWAVLQCLGDEGYTKLAGVVRETTRRLREGIEAIPELRVWGDPVMSVMAFGSEQLDIAAVGDGMDERGWHLDRQTGPDALHLMISPAHADVVDTFLTDLREAVDGRGDSRGTEARYSS
ncbi:aminotransferase class V-fold PLP-dependent enzyme [Myxococcota bacterium]|nr:aminotransferase class V-fold PLP-dependent enzyme [Myxococcota bacterium]